MVIEDPNILYISTEPSWFIQFMFDLKEIKVNDYLKY
jgi:hypothetical protein